MNRFSTGRPGLNPRNVFNAILWILSSEAAWWDLPEEYGQQHLQFRRWIELGVFEKILQALAADCYYLVEMDSTFCKVHQHATGAKKILGNQDIGTSRGGKTSKIHALVNENFQLISLLLSGGQVHDSEVAICSVSSAKCSRLHSRQVKRHSPTRLRPCTL